LIVSKNNSDYPLDSVDKVRENLVIVTKIMLAPWVKRRTESFTIGDIYADPEINGDLHVNREMIRAVKEALARLNCEQISNNIDTCFMPPVRVIDRDLLVS